jgi:DNA repair exonuclease SbcCD ATPase subunit
VRIVSLDVAHFGCIRAAQIALGPGLNILFGPNDLGKSSLARAIRAVLLTPHGSTVSHEYTSWQGDQAPEVELVLQLAGERYWRVRKSFGSGSRGSSLLESSVDGSSFVAEAKGRQVDGEIRDLLSWGIPGPGGRGGPKGVPQAFLTTVLLAHQDQVAELLATSLASDPHESGRQRITQALQALAQEPLTRKVLQEAQAKVDEAFTPKGRIKTGKDAPFPRKREEINLAKRELERYAEQVRASQAAQERVTSLKQRRQELQAAEEQARKLHDRRRQEWRSAQERAQLQDQLVAAREELSRVEAVNKAVDDSKASQAELQARLEACTTQVTEADARLKQVVQELEQAREQKLRVEGEGQAQQRLLAQQGLEKRNLELEAAAGEAELAIKQAAAAGEHGATVARLLSEADTMAAEVAGLREQLSRGEETVRAAESELQRLQQVARWQRWHEVRERLARARQAEAEAERLARQVAELRSQTEATSAELHAQVLPDADQLSQLRRLRESLQVAEARLEVGLSVTLRPHRMVEVTATSDGKESEELGLVSAEETFTARRQLELVLEDVADLVVRAGDEEAHEQLRQLQQRWQEEAEPVLAAAGVADLAQLETAVTTAAQRRLHLQTKLDEMSRLQDQIDGRGDTTAAVAELQTTVAEHEQGLEGLDREALAALAAEIDGELESLQQQAEAELAQARPARDELKLELARKETRHESLQDELEAAGAARDLALADLDQGWEEARAAAESMLAAIRQEQEAINKQLQELIADQDGAVSEAGAQLTRAEERLATVRAEREGYEQEREQVQAALADCQGALRERSNAATRVDLGAAQAVVAELTAKLEAIPAPAEPIGVEQVDKARERLEAANSEVDEIEAQIYIAEGALEQVGGEVVREKHERAAEALEQLRSSEENLVVEYEAWRLLLDTLRRAESEQAAHLGQALINPIGDLFEALTHGRYGPLELGPNLETEGIVAAGQPRDVTSLSIGTRDQLSTIFRLCLAGQLGSFLLLDDQLAQSDPKRMEWFMQLLRESAKRMQIVILTCRPDDYLQPQEMPGSETCTVDSDDGLVRAVDLERTLTRV